MKAILKLLGVLLLVLILIGCLFSFIPWGNANLVYEYPTVPNEAKALEEYVSTKENKTPNIKSGNRAFIHWADSTKSVTPYSLVYLHGFSASHEEGGTVHDRLAETFGMNTYYSRLANHGLKGRDGMTTLEAESYFASAMEAVAIGKKLGEKVIIAGTSTGATLGLPIMAHDDDIFAGIFYSPNIALYNEDTKLLPKPFGLNLANYLNGGPYYRFEPPAGAEKFWTNEYKLEAVRELQELINETMNEETFEKIEQPILFCSYYENEESQDEVVSVAAMKTCMEQLSTPDHLKVYKELPKTMAHAMCSPYYSKDTISPYVESVTFLEAIMN